MAGIHHYRALTNAFGREHLLEQGKNQALGWQEDGHEGVNWMRFSRALVRHLDQGKDFHIDDTDPKKLYEMLHHLEHVRGLHKETMIPHVRAALTKLKSDDSATDKHHMEYLKDAYSHLEANGGAIWAEKVRTLNSLNGQINNLSDRLTKVGYIGDGSK